MKSYILYSGGLDSSLATCVALEMGYEAELIHYNNGTLITNDLYKIRHKEICEAYPNYKINLKEINISGMFRKIALDSLEQDILKYKKSLICMGCKLAMHLNTIVLCKQNNIPYVIDGNTRKQEKYPEQTMEAIEFIRNLYKKYDIEYLNPVYELSKDDIKCKLLDRGITIQPLEDTCLFSNTFSESDGDTVIKYLQSKAQICQEIVERGVLLMKEINKIGGIIITSGFASISISSITSANVKVSPVSISVNTPASVSTSPNIGGINLA